jgi:large subunit ribosomal protein L24
MKIKKGDQVVVVAGRDKGRSGLVIAAYPDRGKVLVQGVNVVKKNKKVTYQGGQRGNATSSWPIRTASRPRASATGSTTTVTRSASPGQAGRTSDGHRSAADSAAQGAVPGRDRARAQG